MRHTYDVIAEPRDELYRALVGFCGARAEEVLLVLLDPDWMAEKARDFIDRFQEITVAQQDLSEWPGSLLTTSTATVFRFRITPDLLARIKTNAEGLYDWQQPERLEDLCFLRADGSVLLATIAHENDAFFDLDSEEFQELTRLLPALRITRHAGDEGDVGRDWRLGQP